MIYRPEVDDVIVKMDNFICTYDITDRSFEGLNWSFFELFDYEINEIKQESFLNRIIHPYDLEYLYNELAGFHTNREEKFSVYINIKRKSGSFQGIYVKATDMIKIEDKEMALLVMSAVK